MEIHWELWDDIIVFQPSGHARTVPGSWGTLEEGLDLI